MMTPSNAPNFFQAFGYFNLAMACIGMIAAVQAEVASPEPISGEDLAADITPVIQALQSVVPKLRIESELVVLCCEAVAKVLNERREPNVRISVPLRAGRPKIPPNQIMPDRAGSKREDL